MPRKSGVHWMAAESDGTDASMRPGRVCPGKPHGTGGPFYPRRSACFNEAGASVPRKSPPELRRRGRPGARRSFNEAGASVPRKSRSAVLANPVCAHRRCFNEAGASVPRKRPADQRPTEVRRACLASMRPGRVCPGKAVRTARKCSLAGKPGLASMRPGRVCPGKDHLVLQSAVRHRRGRGESPEKAARNRPKRTNGSTLQ